VKNTKSSSKKISAAIVAVVLAAVSILSVWAMTSTWSTITMSATSGAANLVTLNEFQDCLTTVPVTSHSWGVIAQDQTYEKAVYIKNTGNMGIYVTYLQRDYWFYDNQAHFTIVPYIIEFGLPCQLNAVSPRVMMWEKKVTMDPPTDGYWLDPGKVIKVDIELHVNTIVAGGNYNFNLTFYGLTK